MSKLPAGERFLDLSDYARPVALWLVETLLPTRVTSIQLTFAFAAAGFASIACIVTGNYVAAALLLMLKNILDAADGEMARLRDRPSHTGRFLDSIFDFLINLGIVAALYWILGGSLAVAVFAFISLEFQGTIFNYYYLNQRRLLGGDTTSSINEFEPPSPFPYENGQVVAVLHRLYLVCYGVFDRIMLTLEGDGTMHTPFPNWFMTVVSTMGLGFQLLLISFALIFSLQLYLLPFLCLYGGVGFLIIWTRKAFQLGEGQSNALGVDCTKGID